MKYSTIASLICLSSLSGVAAEMCRTTLPLTTFADGESWWQIKDGRALQLERTPGSQPFAPPEEVVVAGCCDLVCPVELVIWDSWPRISAKLKAAHTYAFTGTWNRVSAAFKTPLPKGVQYRLHTVKLLTSAKRVAQAGGFTLKAIEGVYTETQAGVARLDVSTGNGLHIARDVSERPEAVLHNGSSQLLHWRGTMRLVDLFARRMAVPFDVMVPAGASVRVTLPWPLAKGAWDLFADVIGDDGSRAVRKTRFAVLDRHDITPRLPKGKYRIGLNYHRGRYLPVPRRLCDEALVACGAKHSRQSFLHARSILPKEPGGACDFRAADEVVAEMHRLGTDINCFVDFGDRARLEEYGEAVARHYGTDLAYYEIGNEWEIPHFFPGTTAEAIDIATRLARGLKKGCPDATVTLCGWAAADDIKNRTTNKNIQRELMQAAKGLYDVHAMHLHGGFLSFRHRFVNIFLPNRKKWGIDVPIYMNETAQTTAHADERDVAACVWQKIAFSWAYGSTDYIWYNLRATGYDPTDGEQGYGIMSADFYPRGTYAALSAFTALFNGWDRPVILRSDEDGECYRFTGARDGVDECVLLGWESSAVDETTRNIAVKTDAKRALLCDIMNNAIELPLANGRVAWPFGALPTALRLVGATFAEPDKAALAQKPPPPVLCVRGADAPDMVCDCQRNVKEHFKADPAMAHRIWQGPTDCSVKAWFGARSSATNRVLTCRFAVTDDLEQLGAHSDRMRLTLAMGEARWEFVFFRSEKGEKGSWIWNKKGDIGGKRRSALWRRMRYDITRKGAVTYYAIELDADAFGLPKDPFDGTLSAAFYAVDADGEGEDAEVGLRRPRVLTREKVNK